MQELVIASDNKGKIKEIRQLIDNITLRSLADIGFTELIPEPYNTFDENAKVKAETIHQFSGANVFADDSGLCVNALNGAPGVHSAYYAGTEKNDDANLQKMLADMQGHSDRTAYYKAIICLIWDSETHFFEGVCDGQIATEKRGIGGFGYDPVFIPDGYTQTFGELPAEVKNEISHRANAVRKMVAFLAEKTEDK